MGTQLESQILESSYSPYVQLDAQLTFWARLTGGVRADIFQFKVQDRCPSVCPQHAAGYASDTLPTTKGSLALGPWKGTEVFLNAGTGFHSNDARAVVTNPAIQPLARATGYEVGARTRQWDRVEFLVSLWSLDLQSELVFSGDAGTTEIRGATRRYGIELGNRTQLTDWLTFAGDLTFTRATFRGTDAAIPQAPLTMGRAELLARLPMGLTSSLQLVHLGPRWLTEDRSVSAQGFSILNVMARYRAPSGRWQRLEAFLSIHNLLNAAWRQNQLFYESRLPAETAPVGDIHFVSGLPRLIMGGLSWYF